MENYRISTCHKNIFCLCHRIVKRGLTKKPVSFIWGRALSAPLEAGDCCQAGAAPQVREPSGELRGSDDPSQPQSTTQGLLPPCFTVTAVLGSAAMKSKEGKQFCLSTLWLREVEWELLKANSAFVSTALCQHGAALSRVFSLERHDQVPFPYIFFSAGSDTRRGPGFSAGPPHIPSPQQYGALCTQAGPGARNSPPSEGAHQRAAPGAGHRWYCKDCRTQLSPLALPHLKDRAFYNQLPFSEVTLWIQIRLSPKFNILNTGGRVSLVPPSHNLKHTSY